MDNYIVPNFPERQNSPTFPVFFPQCFQYFLDVLFLKLKAWSILANNVQFI